MKSLNQVQICAKTIRLILLLLSFTWTPSVFAAYSCSAPSVGSITSSYDPFASVIFNAVTVNLNCTQGSGDASSMAYRLLVDAGLHASGGASYAAIGTTPTINYNFYQTSSTGTPWTSTQAITGTMTTWTGKNSVNGSGSVTFYYAMPASQPSPYTSSTNYTDTRVVTLSYASSKNAQTTYDLTVTANLAVSISIAPKCFFSTTPGTVSFTYRSFQNTPSTASTSFGVSCVANTSYTMALDTATGTLLGLNYTLSLNKTGAQTGTVSAQSITINGTMAANQSGSHTVGKCTGSSCTDTATRTLTITY